MPPPATHAFTFSQTLVALALERAPPGSLPKRFLRVVPLWGLCAGVLLWQQGDVLFASRWGSGTLALVHMFTLGVFGNAMLGSLLQFLPALALVLIPTCSRSICGYRSPFVATVRRSWPPFALSLSKGFDGLSPNGIHMLSPPASAPSRYGP